MTQITKWDAFELSEKIHQKEVSCKEVMTAYLGHINKVNPELNAIVSLQDETGLLKEADQKDKELAEGKSQGCMHGFPIAPKDLTNTKGIKTTMASLLFKDNVPTEDGLMASRMRENGAIFMALKLIIRFSEQQEMLMIQVRLLEVVVVERRLLWQLI